MSGSPLKAPREIRFRWYLLVEKHQKSVKEVCEIFGISKKTFYKWRAKDYGPSDHLYHSRASHPNLKLTPTVCLEIYRAKKKFCYGPEKMKHYLRDNFHLNVSTTIIYRFYKRKRLILKPQKRLSWYAPMKEPYFASKPGENVQLDIKYVPASIGFGWNYQFRFTDTFTNMQYAIDCLDKSSLTSIYALKQAKKYFPFKIAGIQTDNGGEFRGDFNIYLEAKNIIHRFIPKRSAPWNGKVERANRSVDDEYYLNFNRPWKTLAEYVHWYNHERYHVGKGMNGLRPYEKYLQFIGKSVTLEC